MIHIVCKESQLRKTLADLVRRSPTPAAQNIRQVAAVDELAPGPAKSAECVLAVLDQGDCPFNWLGEIRHRIPDAKPLFLLPEDDPRSIRRLLQNGVFDLVFRHTYSPAHLRDAVAHAANGARRPPYRATCIDTREFNPAPGQPWALVCREATTAPTDHRHYMALSLVPDALGLDPNSLLFQEVVTPELPVMLELPSLVFALLSSAAQDDEHVEFLTSLRSLEKEGRRVIYLCRAGISLANLPPAIQPPRERLVRFFSGIDLYLQLTFGFGGPLRF